MANQKHLDILKQGVEVWNQWRREDSSLRPSLRGANLREVNFIEASLHGAVLEEANLRDAALHEANLIDAYLHEANLKGAHFTRADLRGASLRGANLEDARFVEANLKDAILLGANLIGANLRRADLSKAVMGYTALGRVDLSVVKGLETIRHEGPSSIGIDTIIRSQGKIPEVFLRHAGVPDSIIEAIPSLVGSLSPRDYYICFISYSSKDQGFAERLYADLQSKSVRCWFAPEDLKIGEEFWHRIDESIRLYDKLLVVLSEHSVTSVWVENEVMAALEKEHQQQKLVLFPIKLDETVMQTNLPWAANIRRTRHIGDFINWKHLDDYQKGLSRLLRDLKAST